MTIQELRATFVRLNDSWGFHWPGLPQIMNGCLVRLGHLPTAALADRVQAIHDCMQEVAELIENDGQERAILNKEPAYHNRLHVANTLEGLTTLLLLQRQHDNAKHTIPSSTEWTAMLIMLSHDLLHDGSINQRPSQIEARSVKYLEPLMHRHKVDQADQRTINAIILSTDPTMVKGCHAKIKERSFAVEDTDCLTVLIQEADILASVMPEVSLSHTKKLACEWEKIKHPAMNTLITPFGRSDFLRNGALFSSPACRMLGMEAIKSAELLELGGYV